MKFIPKSIHTTGNLKVKFAFLHHIKASERVEFISSYVMNNVVFFFCSIARAKSAKKEKYFFLKTSTVRAESENI